MSIDVPIGWIPPVDGSEECLTQAVSAIRSKRPKVDTSLAYTAFSIDKMIQIWINSPACKFSLAGKCSICDYWDGKASDSAIDQVCEYIELHGNKYETLLLNTCGSCLCEEELPFRNLLCIMYTVAKSSIQRVIFESHLAYVDINKIQTLLNILAEREIIVEYGQESTSPHVLKYCLNKPSTLKNYEITKDLQRIGVKVLANVVLGAPFLTVRQRIQDTIDSIHGLLQSGIDGVVLFPVNIKPYTLVNYLFEHGYYKRVRALEIIKVLKDFSADDLSRIEPAWFEPKRRQEAAYSECCLEPLYCNLCGNAVLKNLLDYRCANDGTSRKIIMSQTEKESCCCEDFLYDYDIPDINACYTFLKNSFSMGEMREGD